ncbi:MAG: ATP synthase subunit I [Burkholderiales bacterium]|nr:ATP synthase subunit I [Burkholderiales bacterium]
MTTIKQSSESGLGELDDFEPMTPAQAQAFREQHPSLSPWWVILGQALIGLVLALIAGWWGGASVALSVGYGALTVVLPAVLFARGVRGRFASLNPGSAMMGFFLWELVKLIVTFVMLMLAPRFVVALSWPAMLVGLVLTMKVYWVALVFSPKSLKHKDR